MKAPEPKPVRLGGGSPPAAWLPEPMSRTSEMAAWRATYEAKVQEFAAETRRVSALVAAMHGAGHRAYAAHRGCGECRALAEVGAIDPLGDVPNEAPEEDRDA